MLHPPSSTIQPAPPLSPHHTAFGLRLLGVIGDLYVIAGSKEGLVLVDQHAAHERVLFEQMIKRNENQSIPSQRLLMPETIEMDHRDAAFLRENIQTLQQMGLGISEFGERAFVIDSLPPFIRKGDIRQLFRNIVDELREAGREVPRGRLSEAAVATTVCRHAVKAHDPLRTEEIERLLQDLERCDLPYTCPHGRPTMIQFSYAELEKKFGRKV
jgi:DNA mismatch repair protein MutL